MTGGPARGLAALLAAGLLLGTGACGPKPAASSDQPLKVAATFSVVGDLVRVIGGEHVALTVLAGPGVDAHAFIPTAGDAAALAKAAVVVENGLGFETWLDDLYTAADSQATRVAAADGIAPRAGTGEETGEADPHVWHSATNAMAMARNIKAALAAADPANAAAYQTNTDAYLAELTALDGWIAEQVSALPAERRKLVTTHDTFGYFAQRYGFEVLGSLLPTSTEGASPSAQQVAALAQAVKAADVPAIFGENIGANGLLNQVAAEAGVKLVATLFTDALGAPGSGGETYVDMMRANVTTIVAALGS
ncbi:MAG: zinc ABC transporter substrate-binding protein [Anaerolineales bacterium]|nr:zinc ABC transporter substrate-binding protein [Anaerolineales bacterium]